MCNSRQNAITDKTVTLTKFRELVQHDTQSSHNMMPVAIAMAIVALVLFIVQR